MVDGRDDALLRPIRFYLVNGSSMCPHQAIPTFELDSGKVEVGRGGGGHMEITEDVNSRQGTMTFNWEKGRRKQKRWIN